MEKYKWDVGKVYSTKEMQKLMGISESTWAHKKNTYLDNFALYYEYNVEYDGNKINYRILKQFGDYKKPANKRDKEKRDQVYSQEIISVVEEDNIQTAANVSRIIKDHEPIRQLHHTEGTIYEYTRVRMRLMFGNKEGAGGTIGGIMEKVWCKLDAETNCYIPMSEEDIGALFSLIKQEKGGLTEKEIEIYNDYQLDIITIEERDKKIGNLGFSAFLSAKKKFKTKYGYNPIKVPVYGFYGKDFLIFDEEKTVAA